MKKTNLAAAIAVVFAAPVAAQTDKNTDSSALTLGTVNIQATASGPLSARQVFSSVDILGASMLEDQHVDYSWELLSRAPGVQVAQFKQGTDAGRFSFRGFNCEGHINAIKLMIDGIPNNGNGNGNGSGMPFLDAGFPQDIEAIEIVRGTDQPRYGLNNIAGNANAITRTNTVASSKGWAVDSSRPCCGGLDGCATSARRRALTDLTPLRPLSINLPSDRLFVRSSPTCRPALVRA